MALSNANSQSEDHEFDLLVIGAGPAGMAAALTAKIEGLSVLLCEKTAFVGGTAATSAGSLWIPGNRQSREAGFEDTKAAAAEYMDALIGQTDNTSLRDAFLETGPKVIDYLESRTSVRFQPCGPHPDYKDLPGAAYAGRAIIPRTFDARVLGREFERIRPPIPEFMVFGGMMVGKDDIPKLLGRFRSFHNFFYAARLFGRYLKDRLRYSRGTRLVMGNALVGRLYFSLREKNVPTWFNARLVRVVEEDGVVVGAELDREGKSIRVRAKSGVVLATGGYAHNAELRAHFMPSPAPSRSLAPKTTVGEGIFAALKIGAEATKPMRGTGAFWSPVSVTHYSDGTKGLFPHLSLDRAKPGLIAVNGDGERFVNEADSYHDFVEAMLADPTISDERPGWFICEHRFVQKYGLGAIYPQTRNTASFERSGYLIKATSLEILAGKIGVSSSALQQTIERYNDYCVRGKDTEFGKGESELNRFNGDKKVAPNPCLAPIKEGPFAAMAVYAAEIGCSSGLDTDEDGRVLNREGQPIRGLFACGNDMSSVMRGTYPGPGTTLGPGVVFGYRIAMAVAEEKSLKNRA